MVKSTSCQEHQNKAACLLTRQSWHVLYFQWHQKLGRSLVNDDNEDLQTHLHNRALRARRLSIMNLGVSPGDSRVESRATSPCDNLRKRCFSDTDPAQMHAVHARLQQMQDIPNSRGISDLSTSPSEISPLMSTASESSLPLNKTKLQKSVTIQVCDVEPADYQLDGVVARANSIPTDARSNIQQRRISPDSRQMVTITEGEELMSEHFHDAITEANEAESAQEELPLVTTSRGAQDNEGVIVDEDAAETDSSSIV